MEVILSHLPLGREGFARRERPCPRSLAAPLAPLTGWGGRATRRSSRLPASPSPTRLTYSPSPTCQWGWKDIARSFGPSLARLLVGRGGVAVTCGCSAPRPRSRQPASTSGRGDAARPHGLALSHPPVTEGGRCPASRPRPRQLASVGVSLSLSLAHKPVGRGGTARPFGLAPRPACSPTF